MKVNKLHKLKVTVLLFLISGLNHQIQSQTIQNTICKECPALVDLNQISADKKIDSLIYFQYNGSDFSWRKALKATFIYNSEKKLIEEKLSYYKGMYGVYWNEISGGLPGTSQHSYKYNKAGNIIEDLFQYSDSIGGMKSETEDNYPNSFTVIPPRKKAKGEYVPDEVGHLYYVPAHRAIGGYKVMYSYDSKNKLNSVLYQSNEYAVLKDHSKLNYTYDEKGILKTETILFLDSSSNWKTAEITSYTYNQKGLKTNEVSIKHIDNEGNKLQMLIPNKTNYTYNKEGKQIKKLLEQFLDSSWYENKQIAISTDADSLYETTEVKDGGTWYKYEQVASKIDAKKNIVNSIYKQASLGEYENVTKYDYLYDEKGNKTSFIETPIRDAAYVSTFKTEYFYSNK